MAKKTPTDNTNHDGATPRRVKLYFSGEAETPAERMAFFRQLRKGQILNYLLHEGPVSRVDISRALGFNLRTVSLLVASLIKDNLIVEKPMAASTTMGRRPVPLELNSKAACVMAIDVRRNKTLMALLDIQGKVLVRAERASDFGNTPEEQSEWIIGAVDKFLQKHHGSLPPLAGAGLSFEGFVFKQHGGQGDTAVTESIREALENWLEAPVSSDTDSRLVAIAEQWFGTARGTRDAVIFNIADGLGVGCIVDGKVLTGTHGHAGEIGHVQLGEQGIPCYCGSAGCLENIVSGSGIQRMAAKAGLVKKPEDFDIANLAKQAGKDKRAAEILDTFIQRLALAVTMTDNLFDPEVIVLGGLVASQINDLNDLLLTQIQKSAVPFILEQTRISFSTLGEDAVLLGAAGQILNHIYSASHVPTEALL